MIKQYYFSHILIMQISNYVEILEEQYHEHTCLTFI